MQQQDQYYLDDQQNVEYVDGNQRAMYTSNPGRGHLEEV